jgi:hypothetical protein
MVQKAVCRGFTEQDSEGVKKYLQTMSEVQEQ